MGREREIEAQLGFVRELLRHGSLKSITVINKNSGKLWQYDICLDTGSHMPPKPAVLLDVCPQNDWRQLDEGEES